MALNSFADREPETKTAAPPRKPPGGSGGRTAVGGDYDPLSQYPQSRPFDMEPGRPPSEANSDRQARYGTPNMGGAPFSRANEVPLRDRTEFTGKPVAYQDGNIWMQSPTGDSSDSIQLPYRGYGNQAMTRSGSSEPWTTDDMNKHIRDFGLADEQGNITLRREKGGNYKFAPNPKLFNPDD